MRQATVTLFVALAVMGATEARAQEATAPASASITIPTVISIEVTNAAVAFPSPTIEDFEEGEIAMSSPASVIRTRSNLAHGVTIEADDPEMSGPGEKPASHLLWGTDGAAGSFTPLSMSAADVVTGLARGVHNSAAEVWYRMVLDAATDAPGTYSLAFTYTAIAD